MSVQWEENGGVICGKKEDLLALALLHQHHDVIAPSERLFYVAVSILLVILSGIAAGLSLGLLALSPIDIEIVKRTGDEQKQQQALKLEKLLKNPHHVLVTLLLCNALCTEALPIVLDRVVNPLAAIFISVIAILILGEVVPQAVCKKWGFLIGAKLAWLVEILMWITWPISWPFGQLLDWALGTESGTKFLRPQLREFVSLHAEDKEEKVLTSEEVQIIHGALDLALKTAEKAMTPINNTFTLDAEAELNRNLLEKIVAAGFSRIPVVQCGDKKNIIGLILVKEMLLCNFNSGGGAIKVSDCRLRDILFINMDTPLYSVLELFRCKRRHMAVVVAPHPQTHHKKFSSSKNSNGNSSSRSRIMNSSPVDSSIPLVQILEENEDSAGSVPFATPSPPSKKGNVAEVLGIITIEDVIEELLQQEIQDETDVFMDNRFEEKVAPTPHDGAASLPPGLIPYLLANRKRTLRAISRHQSVCVDTTGRHKRGGSVLRRDSNAVDSLDV